MFNALAFEVISGSTLIFDKVDKTFLAFTISLIIPTGKAPEPIAGVTDRYLC
jgi:hypothetical protein